MQALVSDALWERLKPLLPPPPTRRFRFPGRKPLDYRKILTGILFVLKTGIAWSNLPRSLGWGCGKTCRHYLQLWHEAGIWQQLYAVVVANLEDADQIDWERACSDAAVARAASQHEESNPTATKHQAAGSEHRDRAETQESSLCVTVTSANITGIVEVLRC